MSVEDSERLKRIEFKQDRIDLAVCGDDKAGIPGLVQRVKNLEQWRWKLDLRIAGIGGGAATIAWLAEKFLFGK